MINLLNIAFQIFGRGFDRWWRGTFQNPDLNWFDIIGDSIGIIVLIFGSIVGLIIIGRVLKSQASYVKPSGHLGVFALNFRDQRLVGFVNKNNEILDTDALERLKELDPDFVAPLEEVQRWIRDGSLIAYDMNIIKKFKASLEGGKHAILLSPVPIEESFVSKESVKGEASLIGTSRDMFKIYPKNVLLSEYSARLVVRDYYGKKINVFILAPVVDTSDRKYHYDPTLEKIVASPLHGKSAYINIVTFPAKYYEPLAKMAGKMAVLTQLHAELKIKKDEIKHLNAINKNLNDENMSKQTENQQLVNMAKIHAFVKGGETILPLTTGGKIAIAIGSAVGGFVAYAVSQLKYFDTLDGAEYLFLVAVIGIIFAILKSQEKSSNELMKKYQTGQVG